MGGAIGWIGAIAGAFLGATVAQLIGQPDMTVPLAIAGSFIGGAVSPNVKRPSNSAERGDGEPPVR